MPTIVRTETRKRGFFGHLFKWLFVIFNILMLIWFVGGMIGAGQVVVDASSEAEKAGATIGTVLGAGFILFVWLVGAVVLGLFAMLTRGKRTIVEEHVR